MSLQLQIKAELLNAQKARDSRLVGILRLLVSEIAYKAMDSKVELTDEDVVAVLRREAKKRVESIEIYKKAADSQRQAQEEYELEVINHYLPAMMSEDEIRSEVKKAAEESGKTGGQLTGLVVGKLRGKADSAVVARLVRELYG